MLQGTAIEVVWGDGGGSSRKGTAVGVCERIHTYWDARKGHAESFRNGGPVGGVREMVNTYWDAKGAVVSVLEREQI